MSAAAVVKSAAASDVLLTPAIFGDLLTRPVILVLALLVISGLVWLYQQALGTDVPYIRGIPEAPGAIPFYGHLKVLGLDHPTKLQDWGLENNWEVLQIRLGNRRAIVLNTFQAAQEWIVQNQTATIDRPIFHTFSKIVSSTQGMTIGTSPWDASCKQMRTALGGYLSRPAIKRAAPILDRESYALVNDMYELCEGGRVEIQPELFFKRIALNLTLEMCYATRLASIDDPLLHDIIKVVEDVASFRSTNKNPQDYVPILRWLTDDGRRHLAAEAREKRDVWLDQLLHAVQTGMGSDQERHCISEGLLKEKGSSKLTHEQIKSVNVSLVSGGFETISTTGTAALGMLGTRKGQAIQEKGYAELMSIYNNSHEAAWTAVVTEEKSPYMVALVREMLRYYAPIQLLPPRRTMKEFFWRGIKIPKGVTVFQNAQAINHDKTVYGPTAEEFIPERWIDSNSEVDNTTVKAPYHYSFGAGSRACPAVVISNRLLYTVFCRLVLLNRVVCASEESGHQPDTHYITYNRDTTAQTAMVKPYNFKLVPRVSKEIIQNCLDSSADQI